MRRLFELIVFLNLVFKCFGANLLFLNGVPSPSHQLWMKALATGLANKEIHNITLMSPIKMEKLLPNIHYIHLEKTYEKMYSGSNPVNHLERSKQSPLEFVINVADIKIKTCQGILESKGLDVILNYPSDFKFDAVIYDFHYGPCLLPLLHRFNYPPLIAVSAFNAPSLRRGLIGGHVYPAYVPFFTIRVGSGMNFWQRIYNTFLYQFEYFYQNYFFLPKIELLVKQKYKFHNMPSVVELERKTTIMLLNKDFAIDVPEPTQPNVILVGGLHITEAKSLNNNLKLFMENEKKGTVFMSLGTNIKSSMLNNETLINILATFASLSDYNFIWKFEADELPIEKPANVEISKFLPQNDILAHDKLKVFITHGGLLSTQELIWHGKPMIGIPFFGDQYRNVERSVDIGVAEKVEFRELATANFKSKLLKLLENSSYTENAQKLSKIFRDKSDNPMDRAIWWIEYILRNPKPDHIRSPTLELGTFVSGNYDIMSITILVLIIFTYLVILMTRKFLMAVSKLIFPIKHAKVD